MRILPLFLGALVSWLSVSALQGATITEVKYRLEGKSVARMMYSGRGEWGPDKYWKLLGDEPMFASENKLVPDQPDGKVATLRGKVKVSIMVRSTIIGIVDCENLKLIRKNAKSTSWYLPKEEMKRLATLAAKAKEESGKAKKD